MYKKSSSIKEKSFTVIELLVVIALIGLLASIVLVSFNLPEKRYRATVAKSLDFSQSIQNALGINAVGWWNFDDDISDGQVTDTSGNGNAGQLCDSTGCGAGKGPSQTDDTPHKVAGTGGGKWALSFDGGDDYVKVPDSASLDTIFGTTVWTLEAWAYPKNWVDWTSIINKATEGWWSNATAGIWASTEGFCATQGTNRPGNPDCWGTRVCSKPPLNRWYHLVGRADGTKLSLFVNGELKIETDIPACIKDYLTPNDAFLTIAPRCVGCGPYFNGLIDEVRLYSQALSAHKIQQHYVEGLKTHPQFAQK